MSATFLQIVVTVWLGVHPVTMTLPHLYPGMQEEACQQRLGELFSMRKDKHMHMELECVPTDKRPT